MPCYIVKSGKGKKVKNLGWLLRNWKDVSSFSYFPRLHGRNPWPETGFAGTLVAYLKTGTGDHYLTGFADESCLRWFLDRPVFRGLLCSWFDKPGQEHPTLETIGSILWRGRIRQSQAPVGPPVPEGQEPIIVKIQQREGRYPE